MACHWRRIKIVELLLKEGKADVNAETQCGLILNPLACAMWKNVPKIVKILLRYDASID